MAPWAATVVSGWHEAIPLTASLQLNATVTGVPYQPAAFGLVVARPVIVGALLSTRTVTTDSGVSLLPAWSTLQ